MKSVTKRGRRALSLAVAALAAMPLSAVAQGVGTTFTLRGGVETRPEYFGSDKQELAPALGFRLGSIELPNGMVIGTPGAQPFDEGMKLRGSFRYLSSRDAGDHPELAGLNDVDDAIELGLGLSYITWNWRAFGNLRYGVTGHNSVVGELGADALFRVSDQFLIHAGPRVDLASNSFARTYFGVTADELVPGSDLVAYRPEGGVMSVGLEVGMRYAFNDTWTLVGTASWDKYQDDAARSPIVEQGSEDQYGARIAIERTFRTGG